MEFLDYMYIGLFTMIILIAGLSFSKSGSDMKSFFAAGGGVHWSVSGLSLFMSFFSAGTFVVWGSIAYESGLVAVAIQLTMCVAGLVVALLIAPAWRKTGSLTAAEFIRDRLGVRVQKFYTILILFLSLAYMGAFLYPVAKIVNVSTGFSIEASVIVIGLLVMAYTVVGGLWAVIVTDVLQFVILTAAVLMVVPLGLENVGGFSNFIELAPEDFFNWVNEEYSIGFLFAFGIYNTIFIGGNWAYVQRYASVSTPKDARKVGLLFSGLYVISPIIWMLPPMIYRVINADLGGLENESAYLLACKAWLPVGMLGLMIGGMIFATASSVNTNLNLSAAVFTNDVYKLFKPNATNKQTMWVARLSTFLFGIGTIIVALLVPALGGIVEVVLTVGAVTGCSLYGPPIWALFSKRHTGKSILACTLLGLSINLIFKFITPSFGLALDRSYEMLAGAIIPLALLAIYEIWARITHQKTIDLQHFSPSLKGDDKEANADASDQNTYGMKVLSITMVIIGLLVLSLSIFSPSDKLLVLSMGGIISIIAILIHPRISILKRLNNND